MAKKVRNFEDLNVYALALGLANEIYGVTKGRDFARDFALREQIRRSAISIVSNIAEGFERGTRNEFIQFLYIAKGSCGELRAQLAIARGQNYLDAATYESALNKCKMLSSMLHNFISYLKGSRRQRTSPPQN